MSPPTFNQRAVARAIDIALLCVLIVGALSGFVEEDADGDPRVDAPPLFLIALLVAVVAYEAIPVRLVGQTLGKRIMKTRVVRVTDGGPPGWRAALTRWGIAVAVLVLIGGLNPPAGLAATAGLYGSALMYPDRRGVVDRLAGTQVVRA